MKESKSTLADKPVSFRIEQSIEEEIQDMMIERREFNKSNIHREIFFLGLELYRKQTKKK